jgi:hypothetical protein
MWFTSSLRDLAVLDGVKTHSKLIAVVFAVVRTPMGKWDVIGSAMRNTGDTVRLVAILVARALPSAALMAMAYLLAHR